MQPVHQCSQDCETLHKEISKKIILILMSSRITTVINSISSSTTSGTKEIGNNWFGLETLMTAGGLQQQLGDQEESVKSFLSYDEVTRQKELKVLVYLDNEEGTIGIEVEGKGGSLRKGKILLEQWTLIFHPKNIELVASEEEIRKLYKRTSLFVRSLHTITRLLPVYNLAKHQKLPFRIEIASEKDNLATLEESLISDSSYESNNASLIESVNKTDLSLLQTNHGDLEIQVHFRKLQNMKFHTISRSPAIRVPQQVIKSRDIQIRSSPAQRDGQTSGEWIEMSAAGTSAGNRNSLRRIPPPSQQNIKILTTAHKPSSLQTATSHKSITNLPDFIKQFEKLPAIEFTSPNTPISTCIQQMEMGRSRKIHVDRWLEELEIEHERSCEQFDLISNME